MELTRQEGMEGFTVDVDISRLDGQVGTTSSSYSRDKMIIHRRNRSECQELEELVSVSDSSNEISPPKQRTRKTFDISIVPREKPADLPHTPNSAPDMLNPEGRKHKKFTISRVAHAASKDGGIVMDTVQKSIRISVEEQTAPTRSSRNPADFDDLIDIF